MKRNLNPLKKKQTGGTQPGAESRRVQHFAPDPAVGLTRQQVQTRIDEGRTNFVEDDNSRSVSKIVCSNIFTYFNLIFFILAAVLLYEGSYKNLTFLGVVVANTLIGIVQEVKAKRTLDSLKIVSEPEVSVIRDGKLCKVPGRELVLDDIVIFEAGNQICADAVLAEGELTVNESLVTGESDEIKKEPGDELLSGSFVVSGTAKARLDRVGEDAFAARLAKNAKAAKKQQRPGMMRSLTRLIQIIGIVIIPFGLFMFWNQHHVLGLAERVSVENTAASLLGMIPEGLYLLTSVALAASTVRLAKKDTLVHDMKCIETLARVDVLCVDKTGTITEPEMQVASILPVEDAAPETISRKLREFARNMTSDNETMKALKKLWKDEAPDGKAVRVKGFSSRTKYSAVDFGTEAYILGAPEMLLPELSGDLKELVRRHSSTGARVLLFASYQYQKMSGNDIFADGAPTGELTPMALLILQNPVRPEARETFGYFKDQGVAIKVISGDNPVTAAMAAQKAGIPDAEYYVDVSALTKEDLMKAAGKYTVFGRVTPEQKRILIRALKKQGHTVAMTGDGVNDVLALKDADCSIAMASGSEAAANVSDLVLLNSDFSGMPHIVAEGRRVINNIQRSATLFLSKNIFSFVLSLLSLLTASLYPLKPTQISVISALMIGAPSFFLALEPNESLIRGKFLPNVMIHAAPAALTSVFIVQWTVLMGDAFGLGNDITSTLCFFLYAFAAYLMLYYVCSPITPWHGVLFGLMGVGFLLSLFVIPGWIQIVPLDYKSVLVLVPMLLLTLPVAHTMHGLFTKLELRLARPKKEKTPKKQKTEA